MAAKSGAILSAQKLGYANVVDYTTNNPLTWHSNNLRHPPRLTTGAINNAHLSLHCITSSKANTRLGNQTQAS